MTTVPSIVVHGGTGEWPAHRDEAVAGVQAAAVQGWKLLQEGGAALDVVEQVTRLLEDDPVFDAGRGSYVNTAGHVELDAIIMDGETLRTGAVAAVRNVANPISLARLVMTHTRHNLLVGDGARQFAVRMSVPIVPDEFLLVGEELAKWEALHGGARNPETAARPGQGTVGVVARDAQGNIASATSTGGTPDKMPGRVGDSPLIGCGAYADNALGGASGTGLGEALMKVVLCKMVCDLMGGGLDAQAAAEQAIQRLDEPRVKGWGGVIAIDPSGRVGLASNARHMARAYAAPDGTITAEI
jgi:L-asparaginase / beta-aspartyl-peptidase